MEGKYKIWCETNEERDAILQEMEKRGWVLLNGDKPTKSNLVWDAPMGLLYEKRTICGERKYIIFQSIRKRKFNEYRYKEVSVKEFLGCKEKTKKGENEICRILQ